MIVYTNKEDFEKDVFDSTQSQVLLEFYADWCAPCKRQNPVLEAFDEQYGEIKIVKVPADTCSEIAEAFRVRSIPTIYFLRDGIVQARHSGFTSLKQLEEMLTAEPVKN